ncbi:MAG: Flp family type IVb pilin [Rhodospirillales bacterium]|nr:Flp family type IVb pilin [Rhodospirillales bacterium]
MIEYFRTWLALKTDARAVTALEYGMIAALIAAVIIGTVATLGTQLETAFTNVSAGL